MIIAITALFSGLLFGLGLTVSQMVNPIKVQAFLDPFGQWDPTLIFVMGGALIVTLSTSRWILKRSKPLASASFQVPKQGSLDANLLGGAALFGIGWGLSGYCPGPGLVALSINLSEATLFIPAMLAGAMLVEPLRRLGQSLIVNR